MSSSIGLDIVRLLLIVGIKHDTSFALDLYAPSDLHLHHVCSLLCIESFVSGPAPTNPREWHCIPLHTVRVPRPSWCLPYSISLCTYQIQSRNSIVASHCKLRDVVGLRYCRLANLGSVYRYTYGHQSLSIHCTSIALIALFKVGADCWVGNRRTEPSPRPRELKIVANYLST